MSGCVLARVCVHARASHIALARTRARYCACERALPYPCPHVRGRLHVHVQCMSMYTCLPAEGDDDPFRALPLVHVECALEGELIKIEAVVLVVVRRYLRREVISE